MERKILPEEWLKAVKKEANSQWPECKNEELNKIRHAVRTGFFHGAEWQRQKDKELVAILIRITDMPFWSKQFGGGVIDNEVKEIIHQHINQ